MKGLEPGIGRPLDTEHLEPCHGLSRRKAVLELCSLYRTCFSID
jgi:hypothetical protein